MVPGQPLPWNKLKHPAQILVLIRHQHRLELQVEGLKMLFNQNLKIIVSDFNLFSILLFYALHSEKCILYGQGFLENTFLLLEEIGQFYFLTM